MEDNNNFSIDDVSGGDDYENNGVLDNISFGDSIESDEDVETDDEGYYEDEPDIDNESDYEEAYDEDYEDDEEAPGYEANPEDVDFVPFTKAIFENFGYEFDPEYMETNDVEGFVNAVEKIVEERSTPRYASEDVAKFDEYVKNGGDPRDFLNVYYANDVDYSEVDLSDVSNKRAIMKDFLKLSTSFSDNKIEKQVNRLEDLDQLDEELEEAIEYLVGYQEEQKQQIILQQHEQLNRKRAEKDAFDNMVINKVSTADHIVGFEVTRNQKEEFLKYVLAPTREGKTEYQKFIEDPDNALSLAFLAFKGTNRDKLVKEVKQETIREMKKNLSRVPTRNNTHKVTTTRNTNKSDYSNLAII